MSATNIEWADAVWNPVRGCTRVSEGCRNCYAEAVAARFSGPGLAYEGFAFPRVVGPRWTGKVELINELLAAPIHWRKPRRIFVNSMSDLFHERLPFLDISLVFKAMRIANQHQFLVLTKRPQRMLDFCKAWGEPLPNVWLGVSVEDQATADERIPLLLQTPAALRFASYEPALGPVDFTSIQLPAEYKRGVSNMHVNALTAQDDDHFYNDHPRLDWIIVGGESGPHARPFDIAWAWFTIAQCKDAGVACFVKQLGANPILTGAARFNEAVLSGTPVGQCAKLIDRKGGDISEWPEDLRVREFPR